MAAQKWWAILAPADRTGYQKIEYVQASSRQQAGDTLPGSTVLGGPYPTEAAARKAHPGTSGPTGTDPASGAPAGSVSAAPSDPLGGIDAVGHFFSSLEDGSLWRSVGWVLLGLALIVIGIMLWLKHPIETAIGTIGGAAAKAA